MRLMQIIHIAMHIIPRYSMLNLGTILGENNTLMVETCFLVEEARIILKECLLETLKIDMVEDNCLVKTLMVFFHFKYLGIHLHLLRMDFLN